MKTSPKISGRDINWPITIKILLAAHSSWNYAYQARKYIKKLYKFCHNERDKKLVQMVKDFVVKMETAGKGDNKPSDIIIKLFKKQVAKYLNWNQTDFNEIEKLKDWWQENSNKGLKYIFFTTSKRSSS